MDYALQTLYYTFQAVLNFLLNLEVVGSVTFGGILLSVMVLSAVFCSIGLIARSFNE